MDKTLKAQSPNDQPPRPPRPLLSLPLGAFCWQLIDVTKVTLYSRMTCTFRFAGFSFVLILCLQFSVGQKARLFRKTYEKNYEITKIVFENRIFIESAKK